TLNKHHPIPIKDPIRVREMSMELQDLGTNEQVQLPDKPAIGNLGVVRYRGKQVTPTAPAPAAPAAPSS
ncbi:MAG: hypothetical protein ACJ786_11575, partial [Catenulispora sp.]